MSANNISLLRVNNLRVLVPTIAGNLQAVRGIDFNLNAGETLGLMGESGCGKSLTALALMGLLPQGSRASGEIWFQNQNLLQLNESQLCQLRGNRIAMIFQEPMTALNPVHTIGHQVAEPLRIHQQLSKRDALDRTAELLNRVGIDSSGHRINAYPHQFSGGQRQRIMIAMALACSPDLLIADEPTTALDVTVAHKVLDLLHTLAEQNGMGLILISHDLGVMARHVQRIMVMYGGQIMEEGTTPSVLSRPAHPYTQGLMASRPHWNGQQSTYSSQSSSRPRLKNIPGQVPALHQMPLGCPFADRCTFAEYDCHRSLAPIRSLDQTHLMRCWKKV
jgi:peptide/nickel transport system ATP-binding protein